jgi:hypothetical protein
VISTIHKNLANCRAHFIELKIFGLKEEKKQVLIFFLQKSIAKAFSCIQISASLMKEI